MILIQEILLAARPKYRRNMSHANSLDRRMSMDNNGIGQKNEREGLHSTKLTSERSLTLKRAIQQYTPVQVNNILHTNYNTWSFCE